MKPQLKAVVFRTARLKETKSYFADQLGLGIKEYSPTHFVIHSKGIRVVFIESETDLKVELYFSKSNSESLTVLEDPNQIKIIIS